MFVIYAQLNARIALLLAAQVATPSTIVISVVTNAFVWLDTSTQPHRILLSIHPARLAVTLAHLALALRVIATLAIRVSSVVNPQPLVPVLQAISTTVLPFVSNATTHV